MANRFRNERIEIKLTKEEKEVFEKKIAEKPYKVVMCAIMRKMVQIIFAVLRNQKSFELRTPEEHQKLIREKSKLVA